MKSDESYRVHECHHGVTVCLRQIVELLDRTIGIALLAVGVPHDGRDGVTRATVV